MKSHSTSLRKPTDNHPRRFLPLDTLRLKNCANPISAGLKTLEESERVEAHGGEEFDVRPMAGRWVNMTSIEARKSDGQGILIYICRQR